MTGVSHSIVTFATLYVATHNVFIAGSAMLGSLFPDKSEGLFWQSAHRSCSHWFVLYVAALAFFWTPDVLSVTGVQMWQAGLIPMMRRLPVLYPTKRMTVLPRLFKVGSVGECLFVIAYCAVLYLIAIKL